MLISRMSSTVGWSCPNRLTRTTLSRAWDPRARVRVDGKETLSGAISVAASANEGVAPPPVMS